MLKFEPRWRFSPLVDGIYRNASIPGGALSEFDTLIGRIATQAKRWNILEHFKGAFCRVTGRTHFRSSNESWAETDLSSVMEAAATNAPLFLEAFFDACEELRESGFGTPDAPMINELCDRHGIGYVIRPPDLILRESVGATTVDVMTRQPTLAERAAEVLQESLQRSERLLSDGRHREAIQETLWVLESVATAFRGIESSGDSVRGKYFNEIARDLRRLTKGSMLDRVLEWVLALHGYLSSPTGGGIRHGLDLNEGLLIGPHEARLFCNLIRSYVSYLLGEHERLQGLRPEA
jgi:hypothetical protein